MSSAISTDVRSPYTDGDDADLLRNPWEVLGLAATATLQEAVAAHRRLSHEFLLGTIFPPPIPATGGYGRKLI